MLVQKELRLKRALAGNLLLLQLKQAVSQDRPWVVLNFKFTNLKCKRIFLLGRNLFHQKWQL
jgi:hypothetical protein